MSDVSGFSAGRRKRSGSPRLVQSGGGFTRRAGSSSRSPKHPAVWSSICRFTTGAQVSRG